ncbi:MAG: PaaI family thioesterase [Candidatus Hodarchaeota archaeon]
MEEEAFQDKWPELVSHCWGCGRNNENGLQIKSYWDGDEAVCTFQPKEYHLAFPGAMNGGIIATLIDCHGLNTANAAAYKAAGKELDSDPSFGFVTGSLYVKFLQPTPMRKPVTVRAKVMEMKERKIKVACSLYSGKKLCATGEVIGVKFGGL